MPGIAAQPMMLALAMVVPAWLAATGRHLVARQWLLMVGGTLGLVLALKLLGYVLSSGGVSDWPRSPSGHVAAGCIIWGGVALAAGMDRRGALALGLAIGVVVGVQRVTGAEHSLAEVCIGASLGLAGLGLLAWHIGPAPAGWHPSRFLVVVGITALVATPLQLEPEPLIREVAGVIYERMAALAGR